MTTKKKGYEHKNEADRARDYFRKRRRDPPKNGAVVCIDFGEKMTLYEKNQV